MRILKYFLPIVLILAPAAAHAQSLYNVVGIAGTSDISAIQTQINIIQKEIDSINSQLHKPLFGSISNPSQVTSSTVSAALPQALDVTASPTFSGETLNGTSSATGYSATVSSTVSQLINFDGTLKVPYNYSSATYGDFGTFVTNWFNAQVAAGLHAVEVDIPVTGITSGNYSIAITASSSNTILVLHCEGLAPVVWTGANTSTILNTGTANKTFFSGWDGCYNEGSGRTAQTFVQAGGPNGNFQTRVTNDLVRNWYRGVVPAANSPFIHIDNDSFQFVTQPLPFNFNGVSNTGENTYVGHTIFGGCEASGAMATGTGSPIYFVNAAGVVWDSNSNDDCVADVGGGSTVTVIGGWNENPGAQTTPYQGVPWWTIENSGTAILTMINPNFWNDISSSVTSTLNGLSTIPPYWISNLGGVLNIQGGMAGTLTTASSVARLVLDGATATTNITGFLNQSNGVTTGVGAIFDVGNSAITMTTGAGFFNCQLNQNSYAWCQKQSANTYSEYFGNGPYMDTIVPSGAGNLGLETNWGSGKVSSSTFTVDGSEGCAVSTPGVSTTILANNGGGGNFCNYTYIGASTGTFVLPPANLTSNRWLWFFAKASGTAQITPSSTDLINLGGNATTSAYNVLGGHGAYLQNDGSTWDVVLKD